jgi:hypothetical protein
MPCFYQKTEWTLLEPKLQEELKSKIIDWITRLTGESEFNNRVLEENLNRDKKGYFKNSIIFSSRFGFSLDLLDASNSCSIYPLFLTEAN